MDEDVKQLISDITDTHYSIMLWMRFFGVLGILSAVSTLAWFFVKGRGMY